MDEKLAFEQIKNVVLDSKKNSNCKTIDKGDFINKLAQRYIDVYIRPEIQWNRKMKSPHTDINPWVRVDGKDLGYRFNDTVFGMFSIEQEEDIRNEVFAILSKEGFQIEEIIKNKYRFYRIKEN